MSDDLLLKRRIERHREQAEQAKLRGDRETFWQERRAMLLAQAEWWEQNHRAALDIGDTEHGELPY